MDIFVQALTATGNKDPNIRSQGESYLNQQQSFNVDKFVISLIEVLSSKQVDTTTRQAAGLYLKNMFNARGRALSEQYSQRWKAIDDQLRGQVHDVLLSLLQDQDLNIQNLAASVISPFACIDLPDRKWPNLFPYLLDNTTVAKMKTVEYICEDSDYDSVSEYLPTVIDICIAKMQSDISFICPALDALHNIIYFAKITENQMHRTKILNVVLTAIKQTDEEIRVRGFQIITTFLEFYFDYVLEVAKPLLDSTLPLLQLRSEDDSVLEAQKTVLNLWQNIAQSERRNLKKNKQPPTNIIPNVINSLLPHLFHLITVSIDPSEDLDQNSVSFSSQDCLYYCCELIGPTLFASLSNDLFPLYSNQDWKYRFQALSVFASFISENKENNNAPLLTQHASKIYPLTQDPSPLIRNTTILTIARLIECAPSCFQPSFIVDYTELLLSRLNDVPVVVLAICMYFRKLGDYLEKNRDNNLCASIPKYVDVLLRIPQQNVELEISRSAITSSSSLVKAFASEQYGLQLLNFLLGDGRNLPIMNNADLVGYTILLMEDCANAANMALLSHPQIINALVSICVQGFYVAPDSCSLLLDSIVLITKANFSNYMPTVYPKTLEWLQYNFPDTVMTALTNLVADISAVLQGGFLPYAQNYIQLVINVIKNINIKREFKPQMIETLGDIILAILEGVEPFFPAIFELLLLISSTKRETDEDSEIEYIENARSAALFLYSVVYQSFQTNIVVDSVQNCLSFIYFASQDEFLKDMPKVVKMMVNTLYDILNNNLSSHSQILTTEIQSGRIGSLLDTLQPLISGDVKPVLERIQAEIKKR